VAVGGDHAGFQLKGELARAIESLGHEVVDVGASEYVATDDYPDFAALVAAELMDGRVDRGVLICGSGVGVCIAVNKHPGLRAGVCHDTYSASQGVEHDDMNVLCLGERIIGPALAQQVIEAFLQAEFSADGRHRRRLDKVLEIESRYLK
jgi:ribose 5-phosphate isomerase B